MVLEHFVNVLHHILAPVFCQRRNRNTQHFSIGRGIQPQIGRSNRLVNQRNSAWIPWRDHDHCGVRNIQRAQLIHGHRRTVIVHPDMIQQRYVRAARPHSRKLLAEIFHSLFHADFCLTHSVFTCGNRCHLRSRLPRSRVTRRPRLILPVRPAPRASNSRAHSY